jgi:hypothetical protein
MRRRAAVILSLAILFAATACAQGVPEAPGAPSSPVGPARPPTTGPADALALCRRALPDSDVVSGTWTTVGSLREWGYGGPVQQRPLADAFAGTAAAQAAVWCWTREAADSYTAWGVLGPGSTDRAITVNGPTRQTPSGPPIIP